MFSPRPGSFGTSLETGEENKYRYFHPYVHSYSSYVSDTSLEAGEENKSLLTSVLVTVGTT